MTLVEAYRDDLSELVDRLDERGVFAPGEREAWEEGIEEADHYSTLKHANESLLEAMSDRDGVEEVITEHTHPETNQFV
ncbi:hypothetical protein EXE53_15345 [Halorubrum sp. SD626R]|uniref:hypothetical protein n=1 Tax=Halorubrum sp. SD626R TaxID=1419722 RepID=UPI0010F4C3E3|nr:hypothetical protein [Halorubrum sp. SD626R]TKX79538.1 hypothetical protein EXE53_15345 [Halorubrum sp. SD626R]